MSGPQAVVSAQAAHGPAVPPIARGLVDDAAVFPPGNAAPSDAVGAYVARHGAWHAPLVGGFVFPATRLEELRSAAASHDGEPLPLVLTVPHGAGTVGEAIDRAKSLAHVELCEVQVPLRGDQLARDARELCARLERARHDGVRVSVEIPLRADWRSALDVLATAGARAKLRTGGLAQDAFPSARALADALVACAARSVRVKCTAGLHRALAHTDFVTGFEYHGFANVLLAVHAAIRTAEPETVEQVLADRSAARVGRALRQLSAADVGEIRRTFLSFGSCSVEEPLADLQALGVVGSGES